MFRKVALFIACLVALNPAIPAQTITGTISGRVEDASGNVIVSASVSLIHEGTGETSGQKTNEAGLFLFNAVPPGTYTIRAEQSGFRSFERTSQVFIAADRLALGVITLQVGNVNEKVTVTAEGATVETASAEYSALLTSNQMSLVQAKGRDPIALLRTLPGVSLNGFSDSDSMGGTFGTSLPPIGGTRQGWSIPSLDGQTTNNPFGQQLYEGMTSMDAIAEVKVIQNTFQAEYGRDPGAIVELVTKSGTKEFHGNVYWYKRHEQLNATDFFNKRNGLAKPLYRYNNVGGTLGGPINLPGRLKNKLFFFTSFEKWMIHNPQNPWRDTMPTNLERAGDFSQTADLSGKLVPIVDPAAHAPFPGNVIPQSRISANGQALLKLFPQPNYLNRAVSGGNYNYVYQEITDNPKTDGVVKLDFNPTSKDRITARYQGFLSDRKGYQGLAAVNSNWPQLKDDYYWPANSWGFNYTRTITPALMNEFAMGYHTSREETKIASNGFDSMNRQKLGITMGQLYPQNNPLNLIPQVGFAGTNAAFGLGLAGSGNVIQANVSVPSPANISYDDRIPIASLNQDWEFRDNFSATRGSHLLKFGAVIQREYDNKGLKGNFGGAVDFSRDTNNPLDSGWAWSNAVLGNFDYYTEASAHVSAPVTHFIAEWFAQDTWKATKKLSLDYGLRFGWGTPYRYINGNAAEFALERYNVSKAPALIFPTIDPNTGVRAGLNPITGALVSGVLIGSYAPNSGDPANGLITSRDSNYPNGFKNPAPIQVSPRFGFAYDPFGDGKTAIRGGFGIMKEMVITAHEQVWNNLTHPPVEWNPTIYYGNVDTFLNSGNVQFPNFVQGLEKNPITPSVYSTNLTIQRSLGFGTVLSVAYVGKLGRHLEQAKNLNLVPYGARFQPQNADPANPGKPLPDFFLRRYPGLSDITYVENAGTLSYNALQVQANRRFSSGFQFGVAYTWSKTMADTDSDGGPVATYLNERMWNYGKVNYDQTHILVFNYTYDILRLSQVWNSGLTRQVFDHWQLSGVTTFASGFPAGISMQTTDGQDITGGGDGNRVTWTGPAELSAGDRSFYRFFDTSVFTRTPRGSIGNTPKDMIRAPGINNWDISVFKNFPLKNEARLFQFRAEAYNAFNHTQFATVDTVARFDPSGKQVNPTFGQVNSTRQPRIMQLSLSFKF